MMDSLTPQEQEAFEQLSQEQFSDPALEQKIIAALQKKSLIKPSKNKADMKKIILQIAAAIALLISGYFLGKVETTPPNPMAEANTYALFLYENEAFQASDIERLVTEYTQWAQTLGEQGKLVGAEKLADPVDWLGGVGIQNQTSKLTGYFLFHAKDLAEAQQIAKTHPHTNYGGGLELRSIDKID